MPNLIDLNLQNDLGFPSDLLYAFDMPIENADLPKWALAIRDWRVRIYKSQPKLEEATNEVLSQTTISRLERAEKTPDMLTVTEFFALLKAFDWTIEDYERETGLKISPILIHSIRHALESDKKAADAFKSLKDAASKDAHANGTSFNARVTNSDFIDIDADLGFVNRLGLTVITVDPMAKIGKIFLYKDPASKIAFLTSKSKEGRTQIAVRPIEGDHFEFLESSDLEFMGEVTTLYRDPTYRH
jgi:transcriptional regulator with XRE-family HTH domain